MVELTAVLPDECNIRKVAFYCIPMPTGSLPPSPPPNPDSRPDSRLVKVANTLIQWTPVGGGSGLLIHFLLRQEWMLALLMFPAMLVTVVWVKFAENFIETLGAIAGGVGSSSARSFSQRLALLNKVLQWRFSGADDRYLRAQADACRDYLTEGMGEARWNAVPMLEDVYVPLGLRASFGRDFAGRFPQGMGAEGSAEAEEKPQYIWDLLRQSRKNTGYQRIAVIARGGFGKTTLLRHITYRYGFQPHRICREQQVPNPAPPLRKVP